MLPILHAGTQYVVPFDDLDFTFLRQYVVKSTDERRVLWSKSALDGESEYYEIELESEEDECDSSYIEPYKSVTCHICNIDVPQAFFKQHCRSRMHQNYKRLTDIVLKNLSKQLCIEVENNDSNDKHEMFYCEACSKAVLVKNKRKHNKTAYHIQSKKNEKQVFEFLELYTKNQSTNDSDNTQSLIAMDEINKNNIDSEYNTASDSDSSECNSEKYYKNHEATSINQYKTNKTCTEDIVLQNKAKDMSPKKSPQFNLDGLISVETPKGYKENVKLRDYHGYLEFGNVIHCKLCDKLLLKEHLVEHNKITMHVANITQPINDDFIRELVNERSHCILCNKIVYPESNHPTDLFHKMLIANILPDTIVPEMNSKQTFCDVCNKYIDTHNFLGHTKGQKHKRAVMNIKGNQPKDKNTATNAVSNSNTTENDTHYCQICQEHIPNEDKQNHIIQKSHFENALKVLVACFTNNKIEPENTSASSSVMSEDRFNPIPSTSKATIAPTSNPIPSASKATVAPTSNPIPSASKATVAPTSNPIPSASKATIAPTSNPIPSASKATIAPTSNSIPSASKATIAPTSEPDFTGLTRAEKLIEYKKQMIELNATQMKCVICDTNVPNRDNNIIEHVEGYNHTENIKDLLNKNKMIKLTPKVYYCSLCDIDINDFISHINVNVGHINKTMYDEIINKKKLIEYVYQDPANNSSIAIFYRDLYRDLLKKNKIIVKVEGTIFFCNVCSIKLTRISEIDHMLGERHALCLEN